MGIDVVFEERLIGWAGRSVMGVGDGELEGGPD